MTIQRQICTLDRRIHNREGAPMPTASSIGLRLKERRQALKLSLRDLAQRTDVSASFLSQVERGQVNASLDSLRRIAEALEVNLLYFLTEVAEENAVWSNPADTTELSSKAAPTGSTLKAYSPVVRANERPRLIFPDSGVTYELLTPSLTHKMEVICGRLAPGVPNVARALREPTEEWIYVLSGVLAVELETTRGLESYELAAGDTIYFEGRSLRRLACASAEEVQWISVITPPVF